MTNEEIIEGNKLNAKFMGGKFRKSKDKIMNQERKTEFGTAAIGCWFFIATCIFIIYSLIKLIF